MANGVGRNQPGDVFATGAVSFSSALWELILCQGRLGTGRWEEGTSTSFDLLTWVLTCKLGGVCMYVYFQDTTHQMAVTLGKIACYNVNVIYSAMHAATACAQSATVLHVHCSNTLNIVWAHSAVLT